jgi:hypothetical protein
LSVCSGRRSAPITVPALRTLVLLVSVLIVSACASAPGAVPKESVGKIKTIGIISSLGTDIHYERVGAGGWDNDFYTVSSAKLGLDSFFAAEVAKALKGRYDVKPVDYLPLDFMPTEDDTTETIAAKIRAHAKPADLDAYLLILRGNSASKSSYQPLDFSAQQLTGLGLTRKSYLTEHQYWAHALYVVVVVDGHTGKVLSETGAPGGYQDLDFLEMPAMGGPYKNADETAWPEDPQNPPAAVVTQLVNGTLKPLFTQSLPTTLKAANLLQ